jgi:hypothetical protein
MNTGYGDTSVNVFLEAAVSSGKNMTLYVLKYTGSVFAAVYGLYATITDFHVHKDGKKVLSTRGYIGIGLLFAASVLSLSSDIVKDYSEYAAKLDQDRKDAAASKALDDQLNAEIEKTAENTNLLTRALYNLQRAAKPIRDLTLAYDVQVPAEDKDLVVLGNGIGPTVPFKGLDGKKVCISTLLNPPDPAKNRVAYDVLYQLVLRVAFYKKDIKPEQKFQELIRNFPPSFAFDKKTIANTRIQTRSPHFILYDSPGRLRLAVREATLSPADQTAYVQQSFDMTSVLDLLKSRALITIEPSVSNISSIAESIRKKFVISRLTLMMFGEIQPFIFNAQNVAPITNVDGYTVYYGKFSDLFHQGPYPFPFGPGTYCE